MPRKVKLKKLNSKEVDGLKNKLLEVRKIGATPIYVKVDRKTSIADALKMADVPGDDDEVKVEAVFEGKRGWKKVELNSHAMLYSKIAVTTKVSGA